MTVARKTFVCGEGCHDARLGHGMRKGLNAVILIGIVFIIEALRRD